ncbi:MAG: AraC family transcriptional regulator [Lachnospiraceae bacterium]|nr:AraC family transcriptional regulator [Lachnospiraceae bacterium]
MKKNLTTNYDDRQYMLAEDYELYYYSDVKPKNRTLIHTHPYYEFYFFLEGHAEAIVNKNHYILSYGDIVIVPPSTPHGIKVKDYEIPYRRFDLWVSPDFFDMINRSSSDYSYVIDNVFRYDRFRIRTDHITFNTILSKLFSVIEEQNGERFGKKTKLYLSVSEILFSINRIAYEQQEDIPLSHESLYQSICSYIEHHIDEDLSLDNLAAHFFLSKFYISHVFKDNIGISIHQYIKKKRLQLCHDAILGNLSINDVYQTYGFDDYSSFYRAFKKEYGISPGELKKRSIPHLAP